MSLSDLHFARRAAVVGGLSLALAGCFRPLYGPSAAGAPMADELSAIQVNEIPDRIGHYLRNELIFLLDGSGQTAPKRYQLTVTPTLSIASAIVDTATTRANAATIAGSAPFALRTLEGGRVLFQGRAVGSTTYERSTQRFATVRAAREAEIRLAKLLAEQIRTRVAAALVAPRP